MARRSTKGMIIDSQKHEVRFSNLLAAGGSVKEIVIALAKDTPAISLDTDVKTGSLVKAIFFELNFNFEGSVTGVFDWQLVKRKANQPGSAFDPAIPNLPIRSQVFMWGMEMPAGINNSSAIKRMGTLLIPKGKQRMSESDQWSFFYRSTVGAGAEDACGHFIYKEYR